MSALVLLTPFIVLAMSCLLHYWSDSPLVQYDWFLTYRCDTKGQWIGDGSPEIQISCDKTEVQSVANSSSSKDFYAMWNETEKGVTTGTHYWKVKVTNLESSSISVGLTDVQKFKKCGTEGLFYGGRLAYGNTVLRRNFGPSIESGNTVGILAEFNGGNLKVYFDLDGQPLGLAYDGPESVFKGIFPCVQFSGPGKATIGKCTPFPSSLDRQEPVYRGIEGDWTCEELNQWNCSRVTLRIYKARHLTLLRLGYHYQYDVHLHVDNFITYSLYRDLYGNWNTGIGITTYMRSSALEEKMRKLFRNVYKLEVKRGFLVMSTRDNGITSKWKR